MANKKMKLKNTYAKGHIPWNKGLTKQNNSILKRISKDRMQSRNPNWKGDNVGYLALHDWARKYLPKPKKCLCGSKINIDASNISGKYKRDLSDWKWECRKCHMENDGRNEKLRKSGRSRKYEDISCLRCNKKFHPDSLITKFCGHSCSMKYFWEHNDN